MPNGSDGMECYVNGCRVDGFDGLPEIEEHIRNVDDNPHRTTAAFLPPADDSEPEPTRSLP